MLATKIVATGGNFVHPAKHSNETTTQPITRSGSVRTRGIFAKTLASYAAWPLLLVATALGYAQDQQTSKPVDLSTQGAGDLSPKKASEYKLYTENKPYNTFWIKVSDIHELHVEEVGNPNGEPVLFVHGGPGLGISPIHRQLFDPAYYRVVLVDQRGAGKSTPYAEIKDNNTELLVQDFETIRKKLGIEKWMIFGGSFGSLLGLVYAEEHPERVTKLIFRGQVTGLSQENKWLYEEGGAQMFFPERFEMFRGFIPPEERHDILAAYFKRLSSPDEDVRRAATRAWYTMNDLTILREPQLQNTERVTDKNMRCARLECYYFMNNCFIDPPERLLKNAYKLKDIPVVIVNGQWDVTCPPYIAYSLWKAIPHAEYVVVPDAGHSLTEPGILQALLAALENHKKENPKVKK